MDKEKVIAAAMKLYESLDLRNKMNEAAAVTLFEDEMKEALETEEATPEPEVAEGLIALTPEAAEEMKELIAKGQEAGELPEGELVLRVAVQGGGCSGFSYKMGFQAKDEITENDVVCEPEGITVVVDNKSRIYLEGTTIDFVDGLMGKGFTFSNPNAHGGTCGCGSSFST